MSIVIVLNDTHVTFYFAHEVQMLVSESRLFNLIHAGDPFASQPFEMCTFVPGTFYHVFRDGTEINPDTDFNFWLKHQRCVGCHFNFVTKKPSVIKVLK
ncbi:hypothetical protein BT69DRAFT_1348757 [Atractiella rhizophila]|nr:hypothetical protein BT69DRAFT_1348757 [Atractiella rhizophila]